MQSSSKLQDRSLTKTGVGEILKFTGKHKLSWTGKAILSKMKNPGVSIRLQVILQNPSNKNSVVLA